MCRTPHAAKAERGGGTEHDEDDNWRGRMRKPVYHWPGLTSRQYANACNWQMIFGDKRDTADLALEYIYINGFADVRSQCPAEKHLVPTTRA